MKSRPWMPFFLAAAAGFLLAVLLLGRYEYIRTPGPFVWRMDRITGRAALCRDRDGEYACRSVENRLPKKDKAEDTMADAASDAASPAAASSTSTPCLTPDDKPVDPADWRSAALDPCFALKLARQGGAFVKK